jgi:hypothetical protein
MTGLTVRIAGSEAPEARHRDPSALRIGLRLVLYCLMVTAALSPLLWVRVPALVDYPNHLARMWILGHDRSVAALARNYVVEWRILPDLAMDLIVPVMARIVPIELAGRLFIALTIALLLGGTAALHRALYGRVGIWPVWATLFVYNAALFWGFLNCLFGIGAALLVFAGWVASRRWRPAPRILVFAALSSLVFLLHLFAFGLYGLLVATYELAGRSGWRRAPLRNLITVSASGLQFVPGVLLWYVSLRHVGPTETAFGGLDAKLYALLAPFTFGHVPVALDGLSAALGYGFLALALASRSLTIVPAMRLPLAALAVVAALMPDITSGCWLADIRVPVALPFLVIASTRFSMARRDLAVVMGAAAVAVLGLRVATVTASWRDYGREFAAYRAASAVITPGAKLLIVASPFPPQTRRLPGLPGVLALRQPAVYTHLAALSVIDRAAFYPYLFTGWTTVDVTAANRKMSQRIAVPITPRELNEAAAPGRPGIRLTRPDVYGELPYWRDWPAEFDFVVWFDFADPARQAVPPQLRLVADRGFFRIYRIRRPMSSQPE